MQEPSVLDFIKARLQDWQQKILRPSESSTSVPGDGANSTAQNDGVKPEFWAEPASSVVVQPVADQAEAVVEPVTETQSKDETAIQFAWPVFVALGLGLWAQLSLEPRLGSERTWQMGFVLYILAALVLVVTRARHGWSLNPWSDTVSTESHETTFLRSFVPFAISLVFSLIAFLSFLGGVFNTFNLMAWFIAIGAMIAAFWQPRTNPLLWVRNILTRPQWTITFSRSIFLALAIIGLILFFRTYRLLDVPSQMISDHAEKLLDVGDVLAGQFHVFFQRNTGREFFQFYLTAAIIKLFDTGLTYLSLKLGTAFSGLVAVFYIYLLGKELGTPRVGMLAAIFLGVAYWHNIISRYGLRFPIYPLFYAPALYYLVWGIQRRNRLGFILSGLFLGLGLHGYSPFRVVPFVILMAVGLYLLHQQSQGYKQQAIWGLFIIVIISLIVFLPLLAYMTENPEIVIYRAVTRLGEAERPLPGPALEIFFDNFRRSLLMFSWDNGEIWPISIPHRPVLDVVSNVFFHLGVVLLILRYIKQRHWFDLFTLLSIPALMMPSILSLSFPGENPSLNRSAATVIPVFLIIAFSFDAFLRALETASAPIWNRRFAWGLGTVLILWAALQNYDLVFNQYRKQYDQGAWNTSEMGEVIQSFANLTGSADTAYLVGFPHWVDSRNVMINAGYPFDDNAIWPENFQSTLEDPRPKLFLININDQNSILLLQALYPNGRLSEYQSKYANKNFMLFLVPAQ